MACVVSNRSFKNIIRVLKQWRNREVIILRRFSSAVHSEARDAHSFGLFFDIDGVITRGKVLLPHTKAAFRLLTDECKNFKIPTIFVTNAGNSMRQSKADHLSELLDIRVDADQVVLSHSPLRMFRQFHDKHVLVCGQGPIEEIARSLGFKNVTTLERFRHCFPLLDTNNYERRKAAPCAFEDFFPKIEGIVLFGEPVSWETSLQIILDVLISDGRPSKALAYVPYPHLPVLACNMDMVWMAEAPMPRLGHGSFMACLESLYKKLTQNALHYSAKLGKPGEITYHYAEHMLQSIARKMNVPPIRTMYCIGDNPASDIYGANLFNDRIRRLAERRVTIHQQPLTAGVAQFGTSFTTPEISEDDFHSMASDKEGEEPSINTVTVDKCESILVCTGVFDSGRANVVPEEHVMEESMCIPSFATVHNVYEAILAVFEKERLL